MIADQSTKIWNTEHKGNKSAASVNEKALDHLEDVIYGRCMDMIAIAPVVSPNLVSEYVDHIVFTGGVARDAGMTAALHRTLGEAVHVPDAPQFTGALGAALLAVERLSESRASKP